VRAFQRELGAFLARAVSMPKAAAATRAARAGAAARPQAVGHAPESLQRLVHHGADTARGSGAPTEFDFVLFA